MAMERSVANKVWINQIINGEFVKEEGFTPSYVEIRGGKVSRVNIMATVVSKFISEDENYGALTIDDGTETIRVKAFGPDVMKIRGVRIGQVITMVGKLKHYNDETYIAPEVARPVDNPNWLIVRRLEIGAPIIDATSASEESGGDSLILQTAREEQQPREGDEVETIRISQTMAAEQTGLNEKILKLIKEHDKGEGADMEKVIVEMKVDKDECKNLIIGLLKSGDLFEPKKGKLKVLD